MGLEGKRAQGLIFKHHFLHAPDWCIPWSKNSRKGGKEECVDEQEFWAKFQQRRKFMECGKRPRPLGRKMGTLSEYEGMRREG